MTKKYEVRKTTDAENAAILLAADSLRQFMDAVAVPLELRVEALLATVSALGCDQSQEFRELLAARLHKLAVYVQTHVCDHDQAEPEEPVPTPSPHMHLH